MAASEDAVADAVADAAEGAAIVDETEGDPIVLDGVRQSPPDGGTVVLLVSRPDAGERVLLDRAELTPEAGLVGDNWRARGSRKTSDGSAEPGRQLTIVNARAMALIAGTDDHARWALAGDQIYADLDLSFTNLPAGTRLRLGTAVVEISEAPHTGCQKFSVRFGLSATRLVNSPDGRALRLRGVNARVVEAGEVRAGDAITKVIRAAGAPV